MTPFDLEVPISSYQKEIDRLDRAYADLGRFPANAQTDEWKRQRDLLQSKAKDLGKERDEQMQAYTTAKRRLSTEKSVWFRSSSFYLVDSRLRSQLTCVFSYSNRGERQQSAERADLPAVHLPEIAPVSGRRVLLCTLPQDDAHPRYSQLLQSVVLQRRTFLLHHFLARPRLMSGYLSTPVRLHRVDRPSRRFVHRN